MGDSKLKIICYTGGTCGDLITALIDPRGAVLNEKNGTVQLTSDRIGLKKPHLFSTDDKKDQYLESLGTKYGSVSSHDLAYHINRNHEFIGITVTDFNAALWAATRFKELHCDVVWQEMQAACGVSSVSEYARMMIDFSFLVKQHTKTTIPLESVITRLHEIIQIDFAECLIGRFLIYPHAK